MAELQEEISQIEERLRVFYKENPPDDIELEKLKLIATALQYLESKNKAFPRTFVPTDKGVDLFGNEMVFKSYTRMTGGIITMFEKAECYGNPRDAINYWLNKRGRRKAFGEFIGFVYGAYPSPDSNSAAARVNFMFTKKEPHIEARKAHKRNLRKRKIKRYLYDRYVKGNTLTDFASGKAEENIWRKQNRDEWDAIKLARKKKRLAKKVKKNGERTREHNTA